MISVIGSTICFSLSFNGATNQQSNRQWNANFRTNLIFTEQLRFEGPQGPLSAQNRNNLEQVIQILAQLSS